LALIATWPDDINIGIALAPSGLVDVAADSKEWLQKFRAKGIPKGVAIFRSGGGAGHGHILMRRPKDCPVHRICRSGEFDLMSNGYCVAPPSMHESGKPYEWVRPLTSIDALPEAPSWVVEMLREAGSVASTPEKYRSMPLVAMSLPEEIMKHRLLKDARQQANPKYQPPRPEGKTDEDRSKRLMGVGYATVEAAQAGGQVLTLEQCAAFVKQVDVMWHGKYDDGRRADLDFRCWEIAYKAFIAKEIDPEQGVLADETISQPASQDYFFDETDGWLYQRMHRSSRRICNFDVAIVADIELDYGEQAEKQSRVWQVRFSKKGGQEREVLLRADDHKSASGIEAAISRECPTSFVVLPGMYGHVKSALGDLSVAPRRTRAYAATGWSHDDMGDPVYVLPHAQGGLGTQGVDSSHAIEAGQLPSDELILQREFSAYGRGVVPPATVEEAEEAWEAFRSLCCAAPMRLSIPVVLQVLAGPLASSGIGAAPPLVHVMGKTGSLKTSFCLAALSLFGTFRDNPTTSWTSTPAYLTDVLHTAKDLTILVDDYKRGATRQGEPFMRFIQNYADRAGRGRSSPSGKARTTLVSRGLLLSNGEDKWEGEASAEARTITVPVSGGDVDLRQLSVVQEAIKKGQLQRFGAAYLVWLARHPQFLQEGALDNERDRWRDRLLKLGKQISGIHLRVLGSHASLLSAGTVVTKFVLDAYGKEQGQLVASWIKEAVRHLSSGASEQAKEIEESSPFRKLCGTLAEAMGARKICFMPVAGLDGKHHRYPEVPVTAEPVGYWEELHETPYALLTEKLTYSWYQREQIRRGQQASFSWTAASKEAREEFGATHKDRLRVRVGKKDSQLSGIYVLLSAVLRQEDGPE
jgi:hypothetical protein